MKKKLKEAFKGISARAPKTAKKQWWSGGFLGF
jgi:hypothetical protein